MAQGSTKKGPGRPRRAGSPETAAPANAPGAAPRSTLAGVGAGSGRRLLVLGAVLALVGRLLYPAPPPRTLEGLAGMLGRATGGVVLPADIAWEPSPGVLSEFFWGRRLLFLSRPLQDGARDLYRARVRVTLEGRPVAVAGIHNLTTTPLGDEQALVMGEGRAAFATSSYAKVESISLLQLSGRPFTCCAELLDTLTEAVTNLRETGALAGIDRVDIGLDAPSKAVGLEFAGARLVVEPAGGPPFALNVATRELEGAGSDLGAHVYTAPQLRKRPILWAVDTIRAEVGPEPVARLEEVVFNARDWFRRASYSLLGPPAATVVAAVAPPAPPHPTVDATFAQNEATVWPPPPIAAIYRNPEPGEGQWEAVTYPWLKHLSSVRSSPMTPAAFAAAAPQSAGATGPREPPAYFYRAMVRPDPDRPYARVLIVAMDMRQLELDMEAGVEDPKPLTGQHGTGRIPRDPAVLSRVVGAFNGAFKTTHGEYGMMVHRRILLPPKPAAATVVVTQDRRVGLGTWGTSTDIPDDIVSFRQNLEPLIEEGRLSPSGRTQWGFQLPGTSMMTERSGLCATGAGQLYYLWGDEVSATTLGKAMILAGCSYGIHLDMNPHHTGFVFASIRSLANKDYDVKLLTPQMEISPERYLEYSPKDFFYLMLRDPRPSGDLSWNQDSGAQPAPPWVPTVWSAVAQVGSAAASGAVTQVELTAIDASRVRFRLRTARREGREREYVSAELGRDDAHRVIASVGLGNPNDSLRGKPPAPGRELGWLTADDAVGLAVAARPQPGNEDAVELPLVIDAGKILPAAQELRAMRRRGAACVSTSGHAVFAMATADSDEPNSLALLRAGCSRAVALDRGSHQPTFVHRTGAGAPPLGRYNESVFYAVSQPLAPRTFRWNAAANP